MLKIAHRGYTKHHHDNSFGAFIAAYNRGFDMIELDIQLDKNDNIIIFHDEFIGNQYVRNMSFYDIHNLHPHAILLSTFFTYFNYTHIKLYFDLKGSKKLAYILHDFLQQNNIILDNIWFASFNIQHLDVLVEKGGYKLGLITDNIYNNELLQLFIQKYDIKFVCFSWTVLDKDSVEYLKSKRVSTFIYTLKNHSILPIVQEYNIDGIVSNIWFNNDTCEEYSKPILHHDLNYIL